MSFQFCIAPDVNCVFVRHLEFVPGEGLMSINEAIGNKKFQPRMNFLRDTQNVALPNDLNFNWFKNDFHETYSREHLMMQDSKFAWIVGSAKDFAKAHSWALVTRTIHGQNRQVFRDLTTAYKWLEIPTDYQVEYESRIYTL